jgi:hypothetical protein
LISNARLIVLSSACFLLVPQPLCPTTLVKRPIDTAAASASQSSSLLMASLLLAAIGVLTR